MVDEIEHTTEDATWPEDRWFDLLAELVDLGIMSWREIASVALGELNPPQVGTALASKKTFQSHYPPRGTWRAVRGWFYAQDGTCEDCGTYLQLESEHRIPRADLEDAADRLDNMQLLCKRCNAKKRPSHANAGVTFLTAQSALMWLLLTKRPATYGEFRDMCRNYGLTMADIRFQEAWALAVWLNRHGLYDLDRNDAWLQEALAEPWHLEWEPLGHPPAPEQLIEELEASDEDGFLPHD